jgi:hypothetical protein
MNEEEKRNEPTPAECAVTIDEDIISDVLYLIRDARERGKVGPDYTVERHVNSLLRESLYEESADL